MGNRTPSGPRATLPTDVQQDHPLLHMWLEPWIPPCVFFGWCFNPWELWGFCLVDIVVLFYEVENPFSSISPSLTPPLGSPCSVQWLAESIHLCICQALAEPLKRQLDQAPVSKHFMAFTIVSAFGDYIWDGSPSGVVFQWSLLQSLLHTLSPYFLL